MDPDLDLPATVPTLTSDRVRLRPIGPDDARTRAGIGRVPEIVRAFGGELDEPTTMTVDQAAAELAHSFGLGPHWVIADAADDRFLGTLRLAPLDVANRSARLGIGILDPTRLGTGLGTAAIRLALDHAFDTLGLHRISLTVLAINARAIAAYERCGFRTEGRLRHTLWRDGAWHDDLVMAVLAHERPGRSPG
ncbi:MAG: GNAT family protein [Actinomycetota bacterium]